MKDGLRRDSGYHSPRCLYDKDEYQYGGNDDSRPYNLHSILAQGGINTCVASTRENGTGLMHRSLRSHEEFNGSKYTWYS